MKRHALRALLAFVAALGSVLLSVVIAGPSRADTLVCEKFGGTTINGGRYVVINNNWGDDTRQCINVTTTGFTITEASHNKPQNGAPGSYPAVYAGCHYANCSSGSSLPMRVTDSRFSSIRTSVSMTYPSSAGVYDAAYDLWFDPTARTDGQNTGAEVMIWLNHTGQVQPVGSRVGTVNLAGATWDVWFGNSGWNVISYVRTTSTTSIDFNVSTFWNDVVSRGYGQTSWYMTSVQAGFEPWVGGTGLAVNNFSYSVGTGGGDTSPPTAPSNLRSSNVTSSGVTLAWNASSDNVGVTGYDVFRGTTMVGTASGTTFNVTGLSASTTYSFTVRARDAAGNTSSASNAVSVTTTGGGGGDTSPPTAPSNLRSSNVTSSGVTLAWNASSDNVGVTGYDVVQGSTVVGTASGTTFNVTGLSASTTYSFTVRARDAAGNTSSASNAVSVTTTGGGGGGGSCRVGYSVNQWNNGFTATVTVTNTGTAAVNGWTLTFTFPGNQRVTSAWSATVTQNGSAVSAASMSYNGTIAPGANTSFGFQGSYSGTNTAPSSFSLNGAACSVA
ncbi:GH12 family glycosyl hydrolase domain-containing protein [Sphaerisporangium aureirubrum]|uniref:Cellulose binding domain-containing protein n=1 Tax=Sphaerisporangium aureirubrum TaxID=1544736 RepID=A0ABW1NFQ6_9ACTN